MTSTFYGQQEGERVLYEVHIHPWVHLMRQAKVLAAGLVLIVLFIVISGGGTSSELMRFFGVMLGLALTGIGWWSVSITDRKYVAYISDRRVVRFSATTPWTINHRSITWDEVVKVKTRSPNFFWRALNIGSVIVHARSTVLPVENSPEQLVTNDDIQIDGISYYQDLGNYLDKILYMSKKEPEKLSEMRKFVAKPKGKRY